MTAAPQFEAAYDRLLKSPKLDPDPVARAHLHSYRPRHLLMARSVARHLAGRRDAIADIGCQDGFFLRLCEGLGFARSLAVDYFPVGPDRSFLDGLPGAEF